jgi:hypothetical protein
MGLADNFVAALAETSGVATNPYLAHTTRLLQRLEAEAATDPILAHYVGKLEKRVGKVNFALDPGATNEFLQLLGEAHFYSMALQRGVQLERVAEAEESRPDFKYTENGLELFFEVKTLSVVDGELGIRAALKSSFEARLSIEHQLRIGRPVATAVSTIQPFAGRPYAHGMVRGVIGTLIEKARQNVKKGQFELGRTFLVLNLSLLGLTNVAKNLWTTAFGEIDYLVHGVPEFEGRPGVEGKLEKQGILNESKYIQGLLLLNQLFDRDAMLSALLRSSEQADWEDQGLPINSLLSMLVGNLWNNDLDSNGFRLDVEDP